MRTLILLFLLVTVLPSCAQPRQSVQPTRQQSSSVVAANGSTPPLTNADLHGVTRIWNNSTGPIPYSIYSGYYQNVFGLKPTSPWDTNALDHTLFLDFNSPLHLGYTTNYPSAGWAMENYYITAEGVPQCELFFWFLNPKVPFIGRLLWVNMLLDSNTLYAGFNVDSFQLNRSDGAAAIYFGSASPPSMTMLYDTGNRFTQRILAGGITTLDASGTNPAVHLTIDGANLLKVTPTELSVIRSDTGLSSFSIKRDSGDVGIAGSVHVGSTVTASSYFLPITSASPLPLSSGGVLWNSNQVLYWITDTQTNLVSDGR